MITSSWEQAGLPKGARFDLISEKSKRHGSICILYGIKFQIVVCYGFWKHRMATLLDTCYLYHVKPKVAVPSWAQAATMISWNVSKNTKTTCGEKGYMEAVMLLWLKAALCCQSKYWSTAFHGSGSSLDRWSNNTFVRLYDHALWANTYIAGILVLQYILEDHSRRMAGWSLKNVQMMSVPVPLMSHLLIDYQCCTCDFIEPDNSI